MDDMKTILANEGVKSLIQKEIKNPIRFLEAAHNELKMLFQAELKSSRRFNSGAEQCLVEAARESKDLNDKLNSLNKQMASNEEQAQSLASRSWVEKEIQQNNERIAKMLSDAEEYRKTNDDRWRKSEGKIMDILEKEKLYELDVQITKETLETCRKDLNQIKVSEADAKLANDKAREEFNRSSKCLLDSIHFSVEEQNKKLERMYEMVQKSSKRIKQESVDLSKDVHEQFDLFEKDFDNRIDEINYKRKNLSEEIERLDQQVQRSMQAGKSNKELDDFMKQVSYNARQIAKIQQSLEGE